MIAEEPTVAGRRALVADAGRAAQLERQRVRGKRTARERIGLVLDRGSFREHGMLALPSARARAAADPPDEDAWVRAAAGDGIVCGTGRIDGRPVTIGAFDYTVMGGSQGEIGALKLNRQAARALDAGHPLVVLFDGGGHRVQEGLEAWTFEAGSGIMPLEIELSGWAPMVGAIMGPVWGGIANFAALMDLVVMVRGIGSAGVAGPALVKAAIGESLTKEELGGPRMQAGQTGLVDLVVEDEEACAAAIGRYLGYFPANARAPLPLDPGWAAPDAAPGAVEAIVPTDHRRAYDVRDVLALVLDSGSLLELRETFAPNAVTCLARLEGRPVGVIANQPRHLGGTLDARACEKLARFLAVCDAFGLPILSFVDVPGFFIGSAAEKSGIARRASRLAFEIGRLRVPLLSVVLRKGYGMGYIGMGAGRVGGGALCVAWPGARIAAMSVEGAVDTIHREPADEPGAAARRAERIARLGATTGALAAAEAFAVDDVIVPSETRAVLADALAAGCAPSPDRHRGFRRIPPV